MEILSYLSNKDKLATGSTCRRWREYLFLPSTWKRVRFVMDSSGSCNCESRRSKHIAKHCGRFVRSAVLELDSRCPSDVQDSLEVLEIISHNANLQRVSLFPTSCRLEHQDRSVIDKYIVAFERIMRTANKLEAISFGCEEQLLDCVDSFLCLLGQYQSHSLKSLHISSVKEYPESYNVPSVTPEMFAPFDNLIELSLDYDYVCNELLECLAKPGKVPLRRLTIHVHNNIDGHPLERDAAWNKLTSHSPCLEVTLILLHSFHAPDALIDIFQPSMRLSHFRQYFCGHVNTQAINIMARYYQDILQSVAVIDSLENGTHPWDYSAPEEDPFVMLAWQCRRLVHFTLIGYRILHENIVAIARLRGKQLQVFEVPDCCISSSADEDSVDPWEEVDDSHSTMVQEVSKDLGRTWEPIPDNALHPAIRDWSQDADSVYMPIIVGDHM